jgi:phosphoserine aminotransferase
VVERVYNFAAGPAALPLPVLERVREDLPAIAGLGVSALEISHRSPWFDGVIAEAKDNLRRLLSIPDGHHVVFCQGGATQQFSMVPMNLLRGSARTAEYVVTGSWGARASEQAAGEGAARIAWSDETEGFIRVPTANELEASLNGVAAYVHVTTNETIHGVEFDATPSVPDGVPLVADGSSDFLSRPVDIAHFGLIYAGAQKNAGPAGVTVVIVDGSLLDGIPDGLAPLLDYRTYVEHDSRYNTPPVFAIYVLMLVTRWLLDDVGGLDKQFAANREKARLLYDEIDRSGGFYVGHAQPGSRSLMNVTFRLPNTEHEAVFLDEANRNGMVELRGHRSVGGIRASLYNAMPVEGAVALAGLMRSFRQTHA